MRKILGLLLAAMGIAFAYAAYENAPSDREDQLADVTRILTNTGIGSTSDGVAAKNPAPASPTSVPAARSQPVQVAEASPAAVDPAQPVVTVPHTPPAPSAATAAWQTSVSSGTVVPDRSNAVTSAIPGDRSTRYELIRALQAELTRVGCYSGSSDGSWSGGAKRAMGAFMERVNATLPIDDPDFIQLTLLQNQKGIVCGRECPKGQSQSDDGRCVPSAILARTTKKNETVAAGNWSAETRVQAAEVTRPAGPVAADTEVLPWAQTGADEKTYETASIAKPERKLPEGRMAVGGPLPSDPPAANPVVVKPAAQIPAEAIDEQSIEVQVTTPREVATEPVPATPASAKRNTQQRLAAVTPAQVSPPVWAAQPRVRVAVPRNYAPRPQRAAVRVQRQRVYSRRSVQNLFTHPLGRM